MRLAALIAALLLLPPPAARPTLDAEDRAAFLAWFTLLADAQFYRPTTDVVDCAALVRHAAREALREHTPEWLRRIAAQTKANVIVDREAIDDPNQLFRQEAGGFERLDRIFDHQLQGTLDTFNEAIWTTVA